MCTPTTNQPNIETQTPRSHPHPQTCLRKSFITVIWCCLSPSSVVPNLYSGLDRGYFISVRIFLTLLQTTPLAKKTSEFLLDIIWVSTDSIDNIRSETGLFFSRFKCIQVRISRIYLIYGVGTVLGYVKRHYRT